MAPWRHVLIFVSVILAGLSGPRLAAAQGGDVLVFAAASLKNAIDDIGARWEHETGKRAVVSYAASPALARQIEQGAPAEMFISADLEWMDYLQLRRLIRPESRANLLGNRIVLIARRGSTSSIRLEPGLDVARLLGDGRLAMADISAVPAGKYGKAALEALGLWPSLQSRIAQSENVRGALLLVSRGEAPLGIVYQTDAAADPYVRIVDAFPENTHPPIIYPAALTTASQRAEAGVFLAYLRSPRAKPLFEKQGFTVLDARSGS